MASVRAKGVRAVLSERAGYVTSLGTKPPFYFNGTLRRRPTQLRQDVFASGGGQQTGAGSQAKGPAKSELDTARVTIARPISIASASPFARK